MLLTLAHISRRYLIDGVLRWTLCLLIFGSFYVAKFCVHRTVLALYWCRRWRPYWWVHHAVVFSLKAIVFSLFAVWIVIENIIMIPIVLLYRSPHYLKRFGLWLAIKATYGAYRLFTRPKIRSFLLGKYIALGRVRQRYQHLVRYARCAYWRLKRRVKTVYQHAVLPVLYLCAAVRSCYRDICTMTLHALHRVCMYLAYCWAYAGMQVLVAPMHRVQCVAVVSRKVITPNMQTAYIKRRRGMLQAANDTNRNAATGKQLRARCQDHGPPMAA